MSEILVKLTALFPESWILSVWLAQSSKTSSQTTFKRIFKESSNTALAPCQRVTAYTAKQVVSSNHTVWWHRVM
eukprot:scaffold159027_cov20-Tisochrysis_lutea.AAC.1